MSEAAKKVAEPQDILFAGLLEAAVIDNTGGMIERKKQVFPLLDHLCDW